MNSHYEMTHYDPSREPDFWSEVPATSPTAQPALRPGHKPVQPMDRVRRLLRGRTNLAIVLALAGALIGAAAGWKSQSVDYMATGWVRVDPFARTAAGKDDPLPGYRQFMASELRLIEGQEMAARAMQQPVWQEHAGEGWTPRDFAASVDARSGNEDNYLSISFQHSDPKIAEAGATAAVQAYNEFFLERKESVDNKTIQAMRARIESIEQDIEALQQEIDQRSEPYGGVDNLEGQKMRLQMEASSLRDELRRVSRSLEFAEQVRERALSPEGRLSVDELAMGDLELAERKLDLDTLKKRRDVLLALNYGFKYQEMINLNSQIAALEKLMEDIAEARVRKVFFGMIPNPDGAGFVPLTAAYIDSLALQKQRRQEDVAAKEQELMKVARDETILASKRDEQNQKWQLLRETQLRLDDEMRNSQFQQEMANIMPIPPSPNSASKAKDRRKQMALGGGVLGFGIPLGLILLIGLLDSRFRYSEDAADAGERVTLLGILPNLPDRLSDPNQASIAAHCVHQIRTILQINHGSDESRSFAVTSASRGDGKTSLALALGLSYAASGARTLLIDTDLQHGGLSARLGVASDEGIMDALSGSELLRYVCETDVTDLAILPIGRAAAHHAGAFSPAAVRHMLDQARRHFDVIICDTGPVLGSIEATPVASSVDGVVLAVSRGQSRPLVSKALSHLESVGATVSGLVFNRAQASDFERSVSGMNLRNGTTRLASRAGTASLSGGTIVSHN